MALDLDHLNPKMKALQQLFAQRYPDIQITSGFRDAASNAAGGGAKSSQHIHGNAMDFSFPSSYDDAKKTETVQWLRSQGINGIGNYGGNSMHVDMRDGAPAVWGPNRSKSSLGQTPGWFQNVAADHLNGVKPGGFAQSAGSPASPAAPASGGSQPFNIAKGVYDALTSRGVKPQVAQGAVASLIGESGRRLDPRAINRGDGADGSDSIGFYQANAKRADLIRSTAKEMGTTWDDPRAQIAAMSKELDTTHAHVLKDLQNGSTAQDGVRTWTTKFEVPQDAAAHAEKRMANIDAAGRAIGAPGEAVVAGGQPSPSQPSQAGGQPAQAAPAQAQAQAQAQPEGLIPALMSGKPGGLLGKIMALGNGGGAPAAQPGAAPAGGGILGKVMSFANPTGGAAQPGLGIGAIGGSSPLVPASQPAPAAPASTPAQPPATNQPGTFDIRTPDGKTLPFTPSSGPYSSGAPTIEPGASQFTPAELGVAPLPTRAADAAPVRQIPIDGAPALNPNPTTANPDASPSVGIAPLPDRAGGAAPFGLPTFASPMTGMGQPAPAGLAQPNAGLPSFSNPVSTPSMPTPAMTPPPLVQADPSPTKVRPEGFGISPMPQRAEGASQMTVFGTPYHGPESGLINQMAGAPTPDWGAAYYWPQQGQQTAQPQPIQQPDQGGGGGGGLFGGLLGGFF